LKLTTVCHEARCPNADDCFSRGTATFLILGNHCTRSCLFCTVRHGSPEVPNPEEPYAVAEAVQLLGLDHVVITSVTRDDLPDGGAGHFAATVHAIRKRTPEVSIEVLVPDFKGSAEALQTVIQARPDVIAHNIETVPRLYPEVRAGADYNRSLSLLKSVTESNPPITTKSGFMLGFGETPDEVRNVMRDLLAAGCSILTIGQYLQPSPRNLTVKHYIHPDIFERWKLEALNMGFRGVASGPFVRSSYRAGELYKSSKAPRHAKPDERCLGGVLCR